MKKLAAVLLAIASVCAFAADAPDKRTPLERYAGDASYALVQCKMALKMAMLNAELSAEQDAKSDWASCIREAKQKAKTNLQAALRAVKKPKAQEALKSYHVALVTALDGIAPGLDERKISYTQRQQALDEKVTEAWARFEIEQ
jgi:hypothetical protein